MWTALPNGVVGGRLRLSVFVSIRLQTDEGGPRPTLDQFPDFLDWPATALTFSVAFAGGPTVPGTRLGSAPRSDLWQGLFTPTTFVRPFEFDKFDDRPVLSYPTRHILGWLREQYVNIAINCPSQALPYEAILAPEMFGQLTFESPNGDNLEQTLNARLDATLAAQKYIPAAATPAPETDFLQLRRFHEPRNQTRIAVTPPEIDFHQAVASLGDYAPILRELGLTHDLEFDFPAGLPAASTVALTVGWAPRRPDNPPAFSTVNFSPKTRYTLSPTQFLAAPRPVDPELQDGYLKLNDATQYDAIQIDLDGLGLKAIDFARNVRRALFHNRTTDTPVDYFVPSARSAGIGVARFGRAAHLVGSLTAQTAKNSLLEANNEVVLDAEDLVRGYRVDVFDDQTKQWHALCRRIGTYRFLTPGITLEYPDEAGVSMGPTGAADDSSNRLYLQESLFSWGGWSLTAPRPGQVIDESTQAPGPIKNDAVTEFKLETRFRAEPKTLPRLRFGWSYYLRARAHDLAGNAIDFGLPEAADFSRAAGPVKYTRFEPVSSPTLLLRKPRTRGEALERLVIRSNFDTPATGPNERHVVPPKTAELMAEQHGLFDTSLGLNKAAYPEIVAKDQGSYATGGAVDPGSYDLPFFDVDQLDLPYYPDVFARGVTFQTLPGAPANAPWLQNFGYAEGDHWPNIRPFRLMVREAAAPGPPKWDAAARTITVELAKADVVRVPYSSFLAEDDLKLMGVWDWLEKFPGLPIATLNELRGRALRGLLWMVTPFRTVTLVHAVQQPLVRPSFFALQATKAKVGDTFATIADAKPTPISGKSTLKLDVEAGWSEPIDALDLPIWQVVAGQGHVAEVPLKPSDEVIKLNVRHEFGDTKHRMVRYREIATTRFREYFPDPPGPGDPTEFTRVSDEVMVNVPNSARPAAPRILYVVPTFRWDQPDGTKMTGDKISSTRQGNGLRIYLERPWFSSGEGELLGVLLWTGYSLFSDFGRYKFGNAGAGSPLAYFLPPPPVPDELKPFVTQWGLDPIWLGGATPGGLLLPDRFTNRKAVQSGLSLAELPGQKVTVVGFDVGYDEVRRLWYCDVELDPGNAYYPFVRLALTRYQPSSIADAHLSRVVLADYAQLAPNRFASIGFDPAQPQRLVVTVAGPAYQRGYAAAPARMQVVVEQPSPLASGQAPELAWVPAPVNPVDLRATQNGPAQLWLGEVTLPEPRGAKPYRLVIKEWERFASDTAQQSVGVEAVANQPTAERLVYVDALEV